MRATLWRDGWGTSVEVAYAGPEVCPDGEVRRWAEVLVTDDEHAADPTLLTFRVELHDLAELAAMLAEVAGTVDR